VFAVAISLTTGWRAGLIAVEVANTEAHGPKPERKIAVQREPEAAKVKTAPAEILSASAPPGPLEQQPALKSVVAPRRPQLHRVAVQTKTKVPSARGRSVSFSQRKAGAGPWSPGYNPIAHTRLTRSRGEVRREYLAHREWVAALTGEDSGSAYLTRIAALQSAARDKRPAHAATRASGRPPTLYALSPYRAASSDSLHLHDKKPSLRTRAEKPVRLAPGWA
jgi:hypothetical protein